MFLLGLTFWIALPETYLHILGGHEHCRVYEWNNQLKVSQSVSSDCNCDDLEKPVQQFVCAPAPKIVIPLRCVNCLRISPILFTATPLTHLYGLRAPPQLI